jgi:hypothetical protein
MMAKLNVNEVEMIRVPTDMEVMIVKEAVSRGLQLQKGRGELPSVLK